MDDLFQVKKMIKDSVKGQVSAFGKKFRIYAVGTNLGEILIIDLNINKKYNYEFGKFITALELS
jgi:hypothetical protein